MYTSLDFYWMPFMAHRQFKNAPRLFRQADGMHLESTDGRQFMDGIAASWWLNAWNWCAKIGDLLSRIRESAGHSAEARQSLKSQSVAADVHNIDPAGRVKLAALPGAPAKRAFDLLLDCRAHEVLVRTSGDIVALSPPLVPGKARIGRWVDTPHRATRRDA